MNDCGTMTSAGAIIAMRTRFDPRDLHQDGASSALPHAGERLGDTGSNGSMIYDVMISLPYITAEHGRSVNVSAKMAEDTEASI